MSVPQTPRPKEDSPLQPATVKKPKTPKSDADTENQPTADELASQKVQNAPLGLADQTAAQKKAKEKGEKTRLSQKPAEPDQTPAPYLGKPAPVQAAPAASQPAVPGAPAAEPPGITQP